MIISETMGYLMNELVKLNDNGNVYFGALTNGKYKVEILINNVIEELKIETGSKIEIIGETVLTSI